MQSYEGDTGLPFVQIYTDDERAKWHLGERLPLVVARLVGEDIGLDKLWANARLVAAAPATAAERDRLAAEVGRLKSAIAEALEVMDYSDGNSSETRMMLGCQVLLEAVTDMKGAPDAIPPQ